VPYYRKLFIKEGINPENFLSLSDIRKIPFLTKDIIKSHYSEFISDDCNVEDLEYMTTGGSTGAPLKIMMDARFIGKNHANTYFYMEVAGYNPHDFRLIRLHGNTIDQSIIEKGIYWALEGDRRLVMSSYHISKETAPLYIDAINQHKPDYIHAFPSAIALLAGYVEKLGLSLHHNVPCIFCDCEVLYDSQRVLIERVFSGRVYNIYGHTEGSVLGISCPESRKIHLAPQVGIVEILDPNGMNVTSSGTRGEIVVTGFYNRVFPFVRYRTFDFAYFSGQKCSCNRNYTLLDAVEGRAQDYVINRNGGFVPLAPALFDYNFDWTGVDRFQICQDTPGKLLFRIVPDLATKSDFHALETRIQEEFQKILNYGFTVKVERRDSIDRTSRGKYRYLDQKINIKKFFQ
jgi:phenylacetate-CoA ligase